MMPRTRRLVENCFGVTGETQIFEGDNNYESMQPHQFVCHRGHSDWPQLALKQCVGATKVAQRPTRRNLDARLERSDCLERHQAAVLWCQSEGCLDTRFRWALRSSVGAG